MRSPSSHRISSQLRRPCSAGLFLALTLGVYASFGQSITPVVPPEVKPAAIPAPPMGWNSWNSFANLIDSRIAMEQARAMANSGLKAAGYEYVVIDEGWWKGERDPGGNILVDPRQWPALKPGQKPGDMSNIAAYIHSLGLKAGIYTDAGKNGCSFAGPDSGPKYPGTGSEGHYDQDFLQFAKWGFDYVKVDWCGGAAEKLTGSVQYAEVARAIAKAEAATGRRLYFSICEWGSQHPWDWAPGVGGSTAAIWRTGGDIIAPVVEQVKDEAHLKRIVTLQNVFKAFDAGIHPEAQHSGYYNDLDMMVIGIRGMTAPWERIHMGLWALSSAPLMVGADLTKLKPPSLALLTNPEVLAVHHDALGLQAIQVAEPKPGLQVWAKPLAAPGSRAVILLNRSESPAAIAVDWAHLGLASSPALVRDLFAARDMGQFDSGYTATVPAQDLVMLVVSGKNKPVAFYPAGRTVNSGVEEQVTFQNVKSSTGPAFIHILYRSRSAGPVVASLTVNGAQTTGLAFPPTAGELRALSLYLKLRGRGEPNVLQLASPGSAIALNGIAVSSW